MGIFFIYTLFIYAFFQEDNWGIKHVFGVV